MYWWKIRFWLASPQPNRSGALPTMETTSLFKALNPISLAPLHFHFRSRTAILRRCLAPFRLNRYPSLRSSTLCSLCNSLIHLSLESRNHYSLSIRCSNYLISCCFYATAAEPEAGESLVHGNGVALGATPQNKFLQVVLVSPQVLFESCLVNGGNELLMS